MTSSLKNKPGFWACAQGGSFLLKFFIFLKNILPQTYKVQLGPCHVAKHCLFCFHAHNVGDICIHTTKNSPKFSRDILGLYHFFIECVFLSAWLFIFFSMFRFFDIRDLKWKKLFAVFFWIFIIQCKIFEIFHHRYIGAKNFKNYISPKIFLVHLEN